VSYADIEAFLNAQDAARPVRKEHHLDREAYRDPQTAFFLTLCARQHDEPFRNDHLARAVLDAIEFRRSTGVWTIYAYCLMPDHLHLVVQLKRRPTAEDARDLLDHVGDFKSFTNRAAWTTGLRGQLWQHDQYDSALRTARDFETRCHYVLNNPVRKGYVEDWTHWPYSAIPDPW
jgi:putative transposase